MGVLKKSHASVEKNARIAGCPTVFWMKAADWIENRIAVFTANE
jgi:hypothetical protein